CPVRADQPKRAPVRNAQRQIIHDGGSTKALADVQELDSTVVRVVRDHRHFLTVLWSSSIACSKRTRRRSGVRLAALPARIPCLNASRTVSSAWLCADSVPRLATNIPTPRREQASPSRSSSS